MAEKHKHAFFYVKSFGEINWWGVRDKSAGWDHTSNECTFEMF